MESHQAQVAAAFAAGAAAAYLLATRGAGAAAPLQLPGQLEMAANIDVQDDPLRRVRKCEAVIQRRTDRLVIVLERTTQSHNYSAVLRTAEALGIQHVWMVSPPDLDHDAKVRAKKKHQWEDDKKELEAHVAYARSAAKW